ncbi:hypothetical protein [uncultured Flavobacterium sp.]|jgi:hypothetical protein|uniref:hypothetical protein n=1 Tax=uncultured Flavobacterium sp. TaxID=165435 RepID=UPI0030CA3333
MKAIQTFLASILMIFSVSTISAQYGNNGYGNNGYGGNGNGRNGGMSQMNQGSQPEKPIEIPAEKIAAKVMEEMKPGLNLDELQTIAISNVLIESIRTQGILLKQVTNQEDQIKEFQALSETTDRKIKNFLNKEQIEKYLIYKENRKNPSKSKSKRKEKKEKK